MTKEELWALFNEKRHDSGTFANLHSVVEFMCTLPQDVSIREVFQLPLDLWRTGFGITPTPLIAFVEALIKKCNGKRLYIPFSRGVDVEDLRGAVTEIDYKTPNAELESLIKERTGIKAATTEKVNRSKYDIVYSDLPFMTVHKDSLPRKIIDDCVDKLSQSGLAVFTFASNVIYARPSQRWLSELSDRGLFVSAVIDLPEGFYAPLTQISARVLVFSREKSDKVFLAKLINDKAAPFIAENFAAKTESSNSEALGKWFDRGTFADFTAYENEQRRKRTAAKLESAFNGRLEPISAISSAVNLRKGKDHSFTEAENAVYIPKLGKSDVVTSLSDLQIKPQNYFQVLVDQEKILPDFLAFILNTDMGITLRLRAAEGWIPSLNRERINRMEVPVPSLKMQKAVLNLWGELDQIERETSLLKDQLKNLPVSYEKIKQKIKDINNRGNKFEQWIDTLPYPLATILKRYTTFDTAQQKQEMLLYFFEAYSIFIAGILIAIYKQPQFNESKIQDIGIGFFEKASFGSWVKIDRAFANVFREQMDKKLDTILSCFHTDDRSLVNLLCLKDVYSILQKTCDYRNSWKGHSGISSEEIYEDHVRVLHDELLNMQERLKDLYEKVRLVRPVNTKLSQGIFTNKVEILTGPNAYFKTAEIVGDMPLDTEMLYMQVLDTGATIELPPLFVMKQSPKDEKNACYFYNRIEGKNSRYVSYHFESKPENVFKGEQAFEAIKSVLERTND